MAWLPLVPLYLEMPNSLSKCDRLLLMVLTRAPRRSPCVVTWARPHAPGWTDLLMRFATSACQATLASFLVSTPRISTERATRITLLRVSKARSYAVSIMSLRSVSSVRTKKCSKRPTAGESQKGPTTHLSATIWSTWWRLTMTIRRSKRMLATSMRLALLISSVASTMTRQTRLFHQRSTWETWRVPHCSTTRIRSKWSLSCSSRASQAKLSSRTCPSVSSSWWLATSRIRQCVCPL